LKIAAVNSGSKVLEVGCGTGVILNDIRHKTNCVAFGIDIDFSSLLFAQTTSQDPRLALADAHVLPFPDQCFDVTICHYFLLWVRDKNLTLREMIRVTRKGGTVIAFAEPDHRSRIDYPANLEEIGRLQNLSLINQGADISAGRKLAQLFSSNGLSNIIYGVYANQISEDLDLTAHRFEWIYLKDDLQPWLEPAQIEELMERDRHAWLEGQRVLYIPTFWAIGWVTAPSQGLSLR
jgi:ubiquinone/menaquinone biosynthesis C-methylase UbiE